MTPPANEDRVALLALCKIPKVNWYLLAREAQRLGGLARLLHGEVTESSPEAVAAAEAIRDALPQRSALVDEAQREIDKAQAIDARLITVLDEDYPTTLRLIFNLPPFLFVRGQFDEADLRSVAVVGTRRASADGVKRSGKMARLLVERGVTVVSGLARGIDTAAHRAALDAGGRTIAVIGTGIRKCYPAENRQLAEEIAAHGALVSQFWPDAPGATYTFPRRNVTMSGIAQGTVVIEASSTSGAKMQARLALEHGKKVFLIKSLTESQEWARTYVEKRGAVMVDEVDDVVRLLAAPERIHAADNRRAQLAFQF
ncbi:DNA-processing protein DprA [Micromonospora costi]|uniref:DNA-protecting protein DprA n=1 Tax=Micromonospora costi TaxID=1530042 RepID=A0A3B0A649_9ACTN|nr:DNA-processing protein DprA [Micromonospora costi]RKN55992.1 DNA-protecting protein DprA [Micromonospora costi]